MTTFDSSPYADSAQARQQDSRMDDWGNPKITHDDSWFHSYDAKAVSERDAAYRQNLSRRVAVALGELEAFFCVGSNVR